MLLTVTTTPATLNSLLSTTQRTQVVNALKGRTDSYITIQNLHGSYLLYLEVGAPATANDSYKIVASTGTITIEHGDLENIYLVSNNTNNAVRVIIY